MAVSAIEDLIGTIRECPPSATIDRARSVFDQVGITRVCDVTRLDVVGVPVCMVVRPTARSLSVSQGKGLTEELAVASGVMESIELHHAETFEGVLGEVTLKDALRSDEFIYPLDVPLRSDFELVPSRVFRYTNAKCLRSGREILAPVDLFDLDFTTHDQNDQIFISSSNGLASGNSRAEAVLHGLCEIVERDQISFWLAQGAVDKALKAATLLDNESIDEPHVARIVRTCEEVGLKVFIWYVTTNIFLPVFLCVVVDPDARTPYPQRASGSGCHPLKSIALSRAVTEALQSRLTHISGARDDATWGKYRDALPANSQGNLGWFRRLSATERQLDYRGIATFNSSPSIDALVCYCAAKMQEHGLDRIYVVDLQNRQINLPVVFVIVPGAEHSARKPHYTPGARMTRFLEMDRTL